MSCLTCQKAKKIPVCTQSLILGTIAHNSTAVWIYIKNLTTGRIDREGVMSSASGVVTLPMSNDPNLYMAGHVYDVFVTLQSASDINDTKDITINGTAYDCLQLRFWEISNDVFGWYPYTSLTVQPE